MCEVEMMRFRPRQEEQPAGKDEDKETAWWIANVYSETPEMGSPNILCAFHSSPAIKAFV